MSLDYQYKNVYKSLYYNKHGKYKKMVKMLHLFVLGKASSFKSSSINVFLREAELEKCAEHFLLHCKMSLLPFNSIQGYLQ